MSFSLCPYSHANKLTELKTAFDLERESLLSKLCKVTGHVTTQTEVTGQGHVMTSSETQTELMAEVISLNSSVSYGSEEVSLQRVTRYCF